MYNAWRGYFVPLLSFLMPKFYNYSFIMACFEKGRYRFDTFVQLAIKGLPTLTSLVIKDLSSPLDPFVLLWPLINGILLPIVIGPPALLRSHFLWRVGDDRFKNALNCYFLIPTPPFQHLPLGSLQVIRGDHSGLHSPPLLTDYSSLPYQFLTQFIFLFLLHPLL